MELRCRIKKALNIKSPAPYEYCSLNLNAYNKKRCFKCKYFNSIKYINNHLTQRLKDPMERLAKSMQDVGKNINKLLKQKGE